MSSYTTPTQPSYHYLLPLCLEAGLNRLSKYSACLWHSPLGNLSGMSKLATLLNQTRRQISG